MTVFLERLGALPSRLREQLVKAPLSPEKLWMEKNKKAKEKGIDRQNSLILDFAGIELPLGAEIKQFPDFEYLVQILKDKVRGENAAYFISSIPTPEQAFFLSHYANALRQLGMTSSPPVEGRGFLSGKRMTFSYPACRRGAKIKEITLVCPFLGYTRGDKSAPEGLPYVESVGLKAIAQTISFFDRIMVIEPHSEETVRYLTGEFKIPTLAVSPWKFLVDKLALEDKENLVVVGPDKGRGSVAVVIAKYLGVSLVSFDKQRNPITGEVTIGDLTIEQRELLRGKRVIIYDDVITTGGTLVKIAERLEIAEISGITVLTCHNVSCGEAVSNLQHSLIEGIYLTDTRLPVSDLTPIRKKVKIVPIRPFLEKVIRADMTTPNFNPWKNPNFSPIVCH